MTSPVNIITPEFSETVLDAAIFVTSTATGTAKANLIKPQPTDIWRAGGLGIHNIDIDLGSAKAVACAAMLFTSMENGTTWTVTAGATQGAATYSSGTLTLATFYNQANVARRHLIHIPASAQTYRWWRFAIAAQAAAFTAGNVVLGPKWLPNVEYGMEWGFDGGGNLQTTDGGQIIATAPWREKRPEMTVTAWAYTEADHEEHLLRISNRADAKPVLGIRDVASANYMQQRVYWGYPANVGAIAAPNYNQWRCRFTVSGMI